MTGGAYVYIQSEEELWTVGVRDHGGNWHPESDHGSSEEAAERVHFLNGGAPSAAASGGVADALRRYYLDGPPPDPDLFRTAVLAAIAGVVRNRGSIADVQIILTTHGELTEHDWKLS